MSELETGPLVSFLQSIARDHEFHRRFMDAKTFRNFYDEEDVQETLNSHGWESLTDPQKDLFRERRTLPKLQEAIEAELNGEDWPYDVSAQQHQHKSIGPCWALVRI